MTKPRATKHVRPAPDRLYRGPWKPVLAALCCSALAGCAATTDRWASQLPEVSDEDAVTLTGRSIFNISEILHVHVLKIDGLIAARFESDEVKSFKIPAGPHKLTLNCYTSVTRRGNVDQPFNYTVPDGKAKMDIDTKPGDELCLKVSFSLLNCAVLEDADPSYCKRGQD